MKKLPTAALALLLPILILTACARPAPPAPTPIQTPAPTPTIPAAPENTPPTATITDEDIAAARAVVERYFDAINAGDAAALGALFTPRHAPISGPLSDVALSDIEIRPALNGEQKTGYFTHGLGAVNGALPENCVVFLCDYTVTFTGPNTGAWEETRYTDWNAILLREGAGKPWLIDDSGY